MSGSSESATSGGTDAAGSQASHEQKAIREAIAILEQIEHYKLLDVEIADPAQRTRHDGARLLLSVIEIRLRASLSE